jgi:hypothetical protein
MRLHLFEFEDLPWFPYAIREGGTDFLRYLLLASKMYQPVAPVIAKALEQTGNDKIIDLCSGGGGTMELVQKDLQRLGKTPAITLTDKFPNAEAFSYMKNKTGGKIDFIATPVDAMNVPADAKGLRTMFSAIHHFKPDAVKLILKNAVDNKVPIAIFDGVDKNPFTVLGMLTHFISFAIFTPFFKPFRWSRLFFTYIIPLIPLYTVWDGMVSVLRFYKPGELRQLALEVNNTDYTWEAGTLRNRYGIGVGYLLGYPKKQ